MIENNDIRKLKEIQNELDNFCGTDIGHLAERLLQHRDEMNFTDPDWYYNFTQCLATLDSASTFHASNDVEKHQVDTAIKNSINEILRLIQIKMSMIQ